MHIGELDSHDELIIKSMESLIPSSGREYYPIKYFKHSIFDIFKKAQATRTNIKLEGPTGSGKTTAVEAYCELTKQPHFVSNMNGSTTSEGLIGAYVPNDTINDSRSYIWKDGIIVRSIRYSNIWMPIYVTRVDDGFMYNFPEGKEHYDVDIENNQIAKEDILENCGDRLKVKAWPRCMLTIEEINFSPEELMSVWFSLLDIRRNIVLNEKNGEVLKAGKFLSINATMNPDYIGTNELNKALNDRFLIKLTVNYDSKVENKIIISLAKKYDFHVNDVKVIKTFVSLIRKGKKEHQCEDDISTRMIEAYMNIKGQFGDDLARLSLLNSFNEDDRDYAASQFAMAETNSDSFDVDSQEMDGLDLKSFKGYKPLENTGTTIPSRNKKNGKAPFYVN